MISYCIFPTSKADEITSRYRPIAPKPQLPQPPLLDGPPPTDSPFLRTISTLQKTRSTKGRKRAKTCSSTAAQKRPKIHITQPCSLSSCLAKRTPLPLFEHGHPCFTYTPSPELQDSTPDHGNLAAISLPPYPEVHGPPPSNGYGLHLFPKIVEQAMDLNCNVEAVTKNLPQILQASILASASSAVIIPQPVRPIGSSINVGCISETAGSTPVLKRSEEVEEEVESEALPSIVSDSNNKVRLANSAYRAMVGQPECPWLDSMVAKDGRGRGVSSSKRISGKVMLDLSSSSVPMPVNRFSCWVKIEWASNGRKTFVDAPCDVTRLSCKSKDYAFTWKFLITDMKA